MLHHLLTLGEGLEVVRDEIGLGRVDPDHEVPKALGSNSRLLCRKNDMTKIVCKEAFSRQAGLHMTSPTQKDFKDKLSSVHIERIPGSSQQWISL